jgi:osmotically-inducible protein OsmY
MRILAFLTVATSSALFVGCAATSTRESTGEYIDNAAITARVKSALVSDPVTKARDISVESFRGTVQLNGFVNSSEEKARAEQVARAVDGVVSVQNNLAVK